MDYSLFRASLENTTDGAPGRFRPLRVARLRPLILILFCLLLLVSTFPTLVSSATRSSMAAAPGQVNGSLEQNGNQQILNLWGTHYEMGYAHGYLLADKIRDLVGNYLVGYLAQGKASLYNKFLTSFVPNVTWYPEYQQELNGIADGMAASGKSLYLSSMKRNIDIRDIKALNLIPEYYSACSSFGVWGTSTAQNETLLGRNLDFYFDSQGVFVNDQLLATYEPTGAAKFVAVSWPGLVGVVSGMNEYGISVMANTGNAGTSGSSGPFHPSIEVFRAILEQTNQANFFTQPLAIINSVEEFSQFLIQLGSPWSGSSNPVYYIEDSNGTNAIRYTSSYDGGPNRIIGTNHFIKLVPPPRSGDSLDRYNAIKNRLTALLSTGDRKVDSEEAFSVLRQVTATSARTLQSLVVRPNRMELDVSLATWINGKFSAATSIPRQTYTWSSLFPNHTDKTPTSTITPTQTPSVSTGYHRFFLPLLAR